MITRSLAIHILSSKDWILGRLHIAQQRVDTWPSANCPESLDLWLSIHCPVKTGFLDSHRLPSDNNPSLATDCPAKTGSLASHRLSNEDKILG